MYIFYNVGVQKPNIIQSISWNINYLIAFLLIFFIYNAEKKLMNYGGFPSSGEKSQPSSESKFWDTDTMI